MKHFLSFLVLSFSIACFADNQPQTSDKKELKGATYKAVATVTRPMHAPIEADIVLVLQEDCCAVIFNNDYGIGIYQFSENATNTIIQGNVNTSSTNYLSIPVQITDSSDVDFYIEFENGSWCHIVW